MRRNSPRASTRVFYFFLLLLILAGTSQARNPIRSAFFNVYPAADGTWIETLPSNSSHCGVCHFDFDGGGPRNPYGLAVEIAIDSGQYADDEEAILSLEGEDLDADGYNCLIEITDLLNFGNTPTFPGLSAANLGNIVM